MPDGLRIYRSIDHRSYAEVNRSNVRQWIPDAPEEPLFNGRKAAGVVGGGTPKLVSPDLWG